MNTHSKDKYKWIEFPIKLLQQQNRFIPRATYLTTLIFTLLIISTLLLFLSYGGETGKNILSNIVPFEYLIFLIVIPLSTWIIFSISIALNELPKDSLSLLKVILTIITSINIIIWLDTLATSTQIQNFQTGFKYLSKLTELVAIVSAVNFLSSYRFKQSEPEKDNVPNQNIDTKQPSDSEKSESKNEQPDNTTENNQTNTSKPEPEQSSEEKESPHG